MWNLCSRSSNLLLRILPGTPAFLHRSQNYDGGTADEDRTKSKSRVVTARSFQKFVLKRTKSFAQNLWWGIPYSIRLQMIYVRGFFQATILLGAWLSIKLRSALKESVSYVDPDARGATIRLLSRVKRASNMWIWPNVSGILYRKDDDLWNGERERGQRGTIELPTTGTADKVRVSFHRGQVKAQLAQSPVRQRFVQISNDLWYQAPEEPFTPSSEASDMWSLGVTMLRMWCSFHPFTGVSKLANLVEVLAYAGSFPERDLQEFSHLSVLLMRMADMHSHLLNRGTSTTDQFYLHQRCLRRNFEICAGKLEFLEECEGVSC